ncbi:glycosyltransferase [Zooshikella harenae]|uniref:Glycosyltransferase n=1 Tax=Zooshikella harenae TaxID=2827238 RepID=A0ABS5Z8P6_9GAMM|nr:glycosyltransferase [Zooshikella harenae]MBU2710380.1 glycosyltransferase [Zooshikella harenae]
MLSKKMIRIHLTNVTGVGATRLLQSLLPEIESSRSTVVEQVYLPDKGELSAYCSPHTSALIDVYHRWLPNSLSRILECLILATHFNGSSPLLVLGDLPLCCKAKQVVFVQTPNLIKPSNIQLKWEDLKYWVSRILFRFNMNRVHAFIVQTDVMLNALEQSYPEIAGKVYVVAQPVPTWLLDSNLKRIGHMSRDSNRLRLIYPAASYPHKNHTLLSLLDPRVDWPVEQLDLTLEEALNPAPNLPWIKCLGFLSEEKMLEAYGQTDALLFLSKDESYGFPLVEAMFVGLPIVCPDLPYARTLCGDMAIYFDPDSPDTLYKALLLLQSRLAEGWWPQWENRLNTIPKDWATVARKMLEICFNE